VEGGVKSHLADFVRVDLCGETQAVSGAFWDECGLTRLKERIIFIFPCGREKGICVGACREMCSVENQGGSLTPFSAALAAAEAFLLPSFLVEALEPAQREKSC